MQAVARRAATTVAIALGLVALAPATSRAAGFELAAQGARAAATGSAGTARGDDPGAAFYNPAALADGAGLRFGAGLMAARPALTASAMDGSWSTTSAAAWSTPPNLALSLASERWAAGVWLGVPFGSGVEWPGAWPGRHELVRSSLTVFRAAPFVAWSFGALRVAAGVHLDAGRLELARDLDFIDTDGDVRMDLRDTGLGVDASAFWQASEALAVGVSYKGATTLRLGGGANFTAPLAFSDKIVDQSVSTTMTLPDRVTLGVGWRQGAWAAYGDVAWARWSVRDATVLDFAEPQTTDVVQMNDWHDTVALRGGVEHARGRLGLRAGVYWDPSPVPAETLSPSSPDADRLGLTLGAGWALGETWAIDVAYERMTLLERETAGDESLPAAYGGAANLLSVGLRYTPAREAE
jgi:long-chain fatty acid transport protein